MSESPRPYPLTERVLGRLVAAAAHDAAICSGLVRQMNLEAVGDPAAKAALRAALALSERVSAMSPTALEQELRLQPGDPRDLAAAADFAAACVDAFGPPSDQELKDLSALLAPLVRKDAERRALEDAIKLHTAGRSLGDVATRIQEAQVVGSAVGVATAGLSPGQPLVVNIKSVATLGTGVGALDVQTAGGLEQRGLGLLLAETGGGKSMFLCHVAAAALLAGYDVFYASLEMSADDIQGRVGRNLLCLDKDEWQRRDRLRRTRWEELCAARPWLGRLDVQHHPPYGTSAAQLREAVRAFPRRPKVVIVDYVGRMRSNRSKSASIELNPRDLGMAMNDLFELAKELDGWVWTAQQITRESGSSADKKGNAKRHTVNGVAGSKEIATIATMVVSMVMDDAVKLDTTVSSRAAHFKVVKNRQGGQEAELSTVDTDFDHARMDMRVQTHNPRIGKATWVKYEEAKKQSQVATAATVPTPTEGEEGEWTGEVLEPDVPF